MDYGLFVKLSEYVHALGGFQSAVQLDACQTEVPFPVMSQCLETFR